MENSKIEWTKHTANLWEGCTKVHEGCDHCYAEALSHRWGKQVWGNDKPRMQVKSVWGKLVEYQKKAAAANEVHSVFVGSMMDIFEKPMPVISTDRKTILDDIDTGYFRSMLFNQIFNGNYPNLMFLLLTKRPSNINKYIPAEWKETPPANVMFGCSVVNQETANKLIPQLLEVKGKRFLSIEPQLDMIDIRQYLQSLHWIIVGGESGPHRRPYNLDWARILKAQCVNAKVPFFFKQIDKVRDKIEGIPVDLQIRQFYN